MRQVGRGKAKQLVMLGGSPDPAAARDLGLATEVRPAGEALDGALEVAARLSELAPLANRMAKRARANGASASR